MNNVYTLQNNVTQRCYTEYTNRDGFTGGCTPPLALARGGGAIFHDKAKDKMRYSNLSNNMMISEL